MCFLKTNIDWDIAYSTLLVNYNKYVSEPEAYPYLNIRIKMAEAENLMKMYNEGTRTKKLYLKMIEFK